MNESNWSSLPCINLLDILKGTVSPPDSKFVIFFIIFPGDYIFKCIQKGSDGFVGNDEGFLSKLLNKDSVIIWNIKTIDWAEFIIKLKCGPPFITKKAWLKYIGCELDAILWTKIDNVPFISINQLCFNKVQSPIQIVIKDKTNDYYQSFNIGLPDGGLICCIINEDGSYSGDDLGHINNNNSWILIGDDWDEFVTRIYRGPCDMTELMWINYIKSIKV